MLSTGAVKFSNISIFILSALSRFAKAVFNIRNSSPQLIHVIQFLPGEFFPAEVTIGGCFPIDR